MAKGKAFFISPKAEVITVRSSHIAAIIDNPERFGLRLGQIEQIYGDYGERLGIEGHAREQILTEVLRRRWIRIREHTNRHWSIQFDKANLRTKSLSARWARSVLRRRIVRDRHMPVLLAGLTDGYVRDVTLSVLANGARQALAHSGECRLKWG